MTDALLGTQDEEKVDIRVGFDVNMRGQRLRVYVGPENQLWRWVSQEQHARDLTGILRPGQNVVARSSEAADFLEKYCLQSEFRDRYVRFFRARASGFVTVTPRAAEKG